MESDYQAYLVRFMRSHDRREWRTLVEDVHRNERYHFVSEKELFLFLVERLAMSDQPEEKPEQTPATRNGADWDV